MFVTQQYLPHIAFFLALVLVSLIPLLIGAIVEKITRYLYANKKTLTRELQTRNLRELLPQYDPQNSRNLDEDQMTIMLILDMQHKKALYQQRRYLMQVSRTISCLCLALFFAATSTSQLFDQVFYRHLSAWVEIMSFTVVFVEHLRSRLSIKLWVSHRLLSEACRQWLNVSNFLKNKSSTACVITQTLTECMQRQQDSQWIELFLPQFFRPKTANKLSLDSIVAKNFKQLEIEMARTDVRFGHQDLLDYAVNRMTRQLTWFELAAEQIRRSQNLKRYTMSALFFVAVLASTLQLFLLDNAFPIYLMQFNANPIEHAIWSKALPYVILAVTTISIFLALFVTGTNKRSLKYKYNRQAFELKAVLRNFLEKINSLENGDRNENSIKQLIIEFERLMTDELVDWIYITTGDRLELSP